MKTTENKCKNCKHSFRHMQPAGENWLSCGIIRETQPVDAPEPKACCRGYLMVKPDFGCNLFENKM